MKDLSKTIREGGVATFNGSQLGINRNGKGSFFRVSNADKDYIENYNRIFKKRAKNA